MRITPKKSPNKKNLITLIVATLILVGLFAVWYVYSQSDSNTNDRSNSSQSSDRQTDDQDKATDRDSDADNHDDDTSGSTDATDNTNPSGTPDYVETPIAPPSAQAPYPIENERHRIEQVSTNTFNVTLYPIVNNPTTATYNQQLRDYKNEVVRYLEGRHGPINTLTVNWTPQDAQNL